MTPRSNPVAPPTGAIEAIVAELDAAEAFDVMLQHLNHGLGIGFAG